MVGRLIGRLWLYALRRTGSGVVVVAAVAAGVRLTLWTHGGYVSAHVTKNNNFIAGGCMAGTRSLGIPNDLYNQGLRSMVFPTSISPKGDYRFQFPYVSLNPCGCRSSPADAVGGWLLNALSAKLLGVKLLGDSGMYPKEGVSSAPLPPKKGLPKRGRTGST